MKNTTKIIISLCAALLVVATVLVVSLVKNSMTEKEPTTKPAYSLQATRAPSTTAVTESWVDLDQMASELATATDTTDPSDTTTDTTAAPVIQTTIVYIVYSETNVATQPTNSALDDDDEPQMSEYKYTINKNTGTVTIDKYLGDDAVVWIPEKISGYTVTAIGGKCFEKQSLKGVVIPEDVTSIGNNAFQGCKNLTSVTFKGAPSTITVGNNAFKDCVNLKSINLPAAKRIGNMAFDSCTSLEKIVIDDGTEEIGDYCFRNCTKLKEVDIPDTVTVIGQGAFSGEHPEDMVIYCIEGSVGHDAAVKYGIKAEVVAY